MFSSSLMPRPGVASPLEVCCVCSMSLHSVCHLCAHLGRWVSFPYHLEMEYSTGGVPGAGRECRVVGGASALGSLCPKPYKVGLTSPKLGATFI